MEYEPYVDEIPWARWPWRRCWARRANGTRCELDRARHDGFDHRAERGQYHTVWADEVRYPTPRYRATLSLSGRE